VIVRSAISLPVSVLGESLDSGSVAKYRQVIAVRAAGEIENTASGVR